MTSVPSAGRRGAMVVLFLVLTLSLAGCDQFIGIYVENRTAGMVQLRVDGLDWREVDGCSTVYEENVRANPGSRTWIEAVDEEGTVIFMERLRAVRVRGRYRELDVKIAAPDHADPCPPPVEEGFTMRLENWTSSRLLGVLGGVELGWLEPRMGAEYGPFEGNWREARGLELRGEDGRDRSAAKGDLRVTFRIDGRLGEIPKVTRWVAEREF